MAENNNPNKYVNELTLAENIKAIVNTLCAEESFGHLNTLLKQAAVESLMNFLKSLPECYQILKDSYTKPTVDSRSKKLIADVLSVISVLNLTGIHEAEKREGLKYRFLGSDDFTKWGVGYLKNLVPQIVDEYEERLERLKEVDPILGKDSDDLVAREKTHELRNLLHQIVVFYAKNGLVNEAIDFLMKFPKALLIFVYPFFTLDEPHYKQACLYITSKARVIHYDLEKFDGDDQMSLLDVAYLLHCEFEDYVDALRVAIFISKNYRVQDVLSKCLDFVKMKQLSIMIARHGFHIKLDRVLMQFNDTERKELQDIIQKLKWSQGYLALAQKLNLMEPTDPEEVYKGCSRGLKRNLADTFVNAFVNAGFGMDTQMVGQENWVFKNESSGKLSETASLGLIMLWNHQDGFGELMRCMLGNTDHFVKAGAFLGMGILNSSVKLDRNPALIFLLDYVEPKYEHQSVRIGAIMGLGLAYACTGEEKVSDRLIAVIESPDTNLEVVAFAAISLGLVCMGLKHNRRERAADAIVKAIGIQNQSGPECTSTEKQLPFMRLICFAFGLLFLGEEEPIGVPEYLDENMNKYCHVSLLSCAYVGSGEMYAVGSLLDYCEEGAAVLGLSMVAKAEEVGFQSAMHELKQFLGYGEQNVRKAVPLALALLCISNPERDDVIEILDQLTRDESNSEVAMSAIISLGLVGSGTNSDKIAIMLTGLSEIYSESDDELFCVQIAQGLLHLGKGLLTLNPYYSDGLLLSPVAFGGLVTFLHCCLDMRALMLGNYHFVLYYLVLAMQPRMLLTVDENFEIIHAPVKVSKSVDVTNIELDETPVLLGPGDRAVLCTDKYVPLSSVLEGTVILKHNPNYGKFVAE